MRSCFVDILATEHTPLRRKGEKRLFEKRGESWVGKKKARGQKQPKPENEANVSVCVNVKANMRYSQSQVCQKRQNTGLSSTGL